MKRTLLQMFCTVFFLWAVFNANSYFNTQAHTVAAIEQKALPIVMYHSILKDNAQQGEYVLSPEVLRQDLAYLKRQGYQTVTIQDLIAYVNEGTALPEKPVMITFDDGYYNNFLYAYPILKDLEMKAVISIIGNQTVIFTENGQENAYWSYLTLPRLQEMVESGFFEIQNHSYDLHTYGARRGCLRTRGEDKNSYKAFLQQDTLEVQELLAKNGLPKPVCYTYPFGSLSDESEEILKELGFQCTLGCEEGMNYITRDPMGLYRLRRYNRPAGISTASFMRKLLQAT